MPTISTSKFRSQQQQIYKTKATIIVAAAIKNAVATKKENIFQQACKNIMQSSEQSSVEDFKIKFLK